MISLCDFTGTWPLPYSEAGHQVIQVDLKMGGDARLWPTHPVVFGGKRFSKDLESIEPYVGKVHAVLAAPVCTVFSNAGARHPRSDEELREALALVDACIRIALATEATVWALENPVGKLRKWLGPPQMSFQPCDYGDPYTKKTLLWGRFSDKLVQTKVKPTEGSKMWAKYGGKSERTKTARSVTPTGFARAFYNANY